MPKRITPVTNHAAPINEAHSIVRSLAEPWHAGDSVKVGINRVARLVGLTPRRIETLWYCRPCALLAHELEELRSAYRDNLRHERERLARRAHELDQQLAILQAKEPT